MYRMTMLVGVSMIVLQFGGELVYSKYMRKDRDLELDHEQEITNKKSKFTEEDESHIEEDLDQQKRGGLFSSWKETRQKRLEKIKLSKERPAAPLLEELKEKPGYKEMKTRKLVERDTNARDAAKDDYI